MDYTPKIIIYFIFQSKLNSFPLWAVIGLYNYDFFVFLQSQTKPLAN